MSRRSFSPLVALTVTLPVTVLVLVEIGTWSDITDNPVWVGRHTVRDLVLFAARIVNPVYSFITPGQRRERIELVFSHNERTDSLSHEGISSAANGDSVTDHSDRTASSIDSLSTGMAGSGASDAAYRRRTLTIFAAVKHPGPGGPAGSWCTLHLFVLDGERHALKCYTVTNSLAAYLSGGKLSDMNSFVLVYGLESVGSRIAQTAGVTRIDYYFYMSEKMVRMIYMALGFDDGLDRFDKLSCMPYPGCFDMIAQGTGELIRETMLKAVPLLDGLSGELLMKSGLQLADTNMPVDVGLGLVYLMNDEGFSRHPDKVTLEVLACGEPGVGAVGRK